MPFPTPLMTPAEGIISIRDSGFLDKFRSYLRIQERISFLRLLHLAVAFLNMERGNQKKRKGKPKV